jgi:hypothetical protein
VSVKQNLRNERSLSGIQHNTSITFVAAAIPNARGAVDLSDEMRKVINQGMAVLIFSM